MTNRRGVASFTTARSKGVTAVKASQNPSGSGGTVGRMAERDAEHVKHSDTDSGDTMKQVQSYEKKMMGRTPRVSANLTDADETSVMKKNNVEEGNDQQTGSINKSGGESFTKSKAMGTMDEDSESGQEDLSDDQPQYRGYTPQEHRTVKRNLKPIRHDMGKKIP